MNRILIDLKENCHGDIDGTIKLPTDSAFALECFAEVIQRFSVNCGVGINDILKDISGLCKALPLVIDNQYSLHLGPGLWIHGDKESILKAENAMR